MERRFLQLLALALVALAALPARAQTPFPYADTVEDTTAALARWASSTPGPQFFSSTAGHPVRSGTKAFRVSNTHTLTLRQPVALVGRTNPHVAVWAIRVNLGASDPCPSGRTCGTVGLEVSTDGGALWTPVAASSQVHGATGERLHLWEHYAGASDAERAAVRSSWRRLQWPLDAYAGSSVLLRLTVRNMPAQQVVALDDLLLDEAPTPASVTVSNTTNRGFTVAWPASAAPDFAKYRLVVSTNENACTSWFKYETVTNSTFNYEYTKCVAGTSDPYALPLRLWRDERRVYEFTDRARTSITLDSLHNAGRQYHVRLYEVDAQGFTNQGGAAEKPSTALDFGGSVRAPFVERFDGASVPAGWLLEPTWGLSAEASAEPGHSAPGVLTDSPGTNYAPYAYSYAKVRMDLSAVSRPVLRFKHRINSEPGAVNNSIDPQTEFDLAFVDASADGLAWQRLGSFAGTRDWSEQAFDLGRYAGLPAVQLRFGFHDDDSSVTANLSGGGIRTTMVSRTRQGWLVDDVEVEDNAALAAFPFRDDAEGALHWLPGFSSRATVGDARSGSTVWRFFGPSHHNDPYLLISGSSADVTKEGMDCTTPFTNPCAGSSHPYSWMTLAGVLDLRSVRQPAFSFYARTRGQSTTSQSQYYVQASVDGGRTWTTLPDGSGPYIGGPDWRKYTFSLDGFQSAQTLVRIGFAGQASPTWQEFDDFEITGTAGSTAPLAGAVEFRLRSAYGDGRLAVPQGQRYGLRGTEGPLSVATTTLLADPDNDGIWTARVPFASPHGTPIRYLAVLVRDGTETVVNDCKQWNSVTPLTANPADWLALSYTGSATVTAQWPCTSPPTVVPGEGVAQFTVSGGGAPSPQVLTTGFHPQATTGLDPAYGETEMPPVPPSGTFTARFVSGAGVDLGQGSLVDLRPGTAAFNGALTHYLHLQRASSGGAFTFAYDLPEQVRGRLRDAVTGNLFDHAFAGRGQVTIPASGSLENVTAFTLVVTYGETCVDASVASGWNMVSAPLTLASMEPASVFPGTTNPFGYDNGYQSASVLVPGRGYWLKASASSTPRLCGVPVAARDIPLKAGWNMIGAFEVAADVSRLVPTPSDVVQSAFFGYDAGYRNASTLAVGKGYWVKARTDGSLRVVTGGAAVRDEPAASEIVGDAAAGLSLVVEDAAGARATLRLVATPSGHAVLPPLPPTGLFDARFVGDGDDAAEGALAGATLAVQGAVYPLTVRADGLSEGQTVRLGMPGSEAVVLSAGAPAARLMQGTRFSVAGTALPTEAAFDAPTPTPARSTAALRFALPGAGRVRLAVYDLLGREVLRPVDGDVAAGVHRLALDVSGLSAGRYVVRLEGPGVSLVRPLVVAR